MNRIALGVLEEWAWNEQNCLGCLGGVGME